MTTSEVALGYDPYDPQLVVDPYPAFKRLREDAPVYYNEQFDFFALSRHADVEAGLRNHQTFISGRGGIIELIQAGMEMPPGIVIFEDPPTHTLHRKLMSRMFTPRNVTRLEDKIRQFTAESLDEAADKGSFDFVRDLGVYMPMRTIGMLMGIPEADQVKIREMVDRNIRTGEGEAMATEQGAMLDLGSDIFAEYIEWRESHPSDDIMTELLHAEFEDQDGQTRTLSREELLTYVTVVSGAGNETTTRLVGWAGKLLADHPDQRRELVADPSLIPGAIEEILRFEGPAPHAARYVAKDYTNHDVTVPAGSIMLMLMGSANRDSDKFPDGDTFDIHRETAGMLTFGSGIHFCLGAALARLEGRVALEEILRRMPEWDVDMTKAHLAPTSTVRGWETLPAILP